MHFFRSGSVLKAFSVDVSLTVRFRGDNSLLSLLFTGKDGTSFAIINKTR